MFGNILNLFKKKNDGENEKNNKTTAKERLHLVLMQDRANVSADFLDMMKQEIIDVIKKYIDVDETQIDVKLTNKMNGDGTTGAPALYANIPIKSLKKETRINSNKDALNLQGKDNENTEIKKVEANKENKKESNENTESKKNKENKTKVESKEKNNKAESKKEVKKVEKNTNAKKSGNNENEKKKAKPKKEDVKKTTFFENIKVEDKKTEEE